MPYLGRSPGSGVRTRFIYAATAGQTSFSGNDSNSVSLAYEDTLYMDVYQNGVLLKPVTDYAATTGTSVVLVTGATTDDVVEMIVYDTFAVADTVSAKDGGTFAGNVAMGGTLTLAGNADFNGNLDVDGTTDLDTTNVVGAFTVTGDVTLNDGSPNLRLNDSDVSRFVDILYGTRVATFRNTMASGEDMDSVEPSMVFSFKDDGETRTAMTIDHDAATTIHSSGGATPTYSHTNNGEGLTFRYNDDSGARAADIVATGNTPAGATMAMRFFTNPASTDNAAEVMRLQNGIVTKPLQPAFQAVPASNQNNIATGTDVTIIFGTERFDVGSNFASNTFTAPVTGKYYLDVQLRVEYIDTAANYYQLKIQTTNHTYVMTLDPNFSADMLYGPMSISIVADMDANDTTLVKLHQSGGTAQSDIDNESYFSGYLLG